MRNRSVLLLLFLMLFCGRAVVAEEMPARKMISFADSLFEKGDYYRAITEYERVIFFHPGDPLALTARFQIAHAYLKGDRIDQAVERFRALNQEFPNDDIGRKAYFMLGEAYYQKRSTPGRRTSSRPISRPGPATSASMRAASGSAGPISVWASGGRLPMSSENCRLIRRSMPRRRGSPKGQGTIPAFRRSPRLWQADFQRSFRERDSCM